MCQGSGWRQEMEQKHRLLYSLLTSDFGVCQLEFWGICTIVFFKALILWKEQQMFYYVFAAEKRLLQFAKVSWVLGRKLSAEVSTSESSKGIRDASLDSYY